MNEKFIFGLALGMLGGAVIATHSVKTREAVKSGEKEIKDKMSNLKKPAAKSK